MDNPAADIDMSDITIKPDQIKEPKKQTTFKMTKLQIIKNLIVVSIGFLFLFTSFQSLSNLQSSLNREDGLGTMGLAIIYGALVISCMFLPPFVIDVFGCKWTVAFSMLCYILYMVANFYAVKWTIIPSAIILGIGAAPLWSAKCTYLTETGVWYSKMTGKTEDDIINRFFGIFFMIFQTSQIWGNLISSLVLSDRPENSTLDISPESLASCGPNDCPYHPDRNNSNLEKPPIKQVYVMCGVYLAFALLGFATIVILLDNLVLDKDDKKEKGKRKLSPKLFLETIKHVWHNHYQKLLIPLTMYSGIEQAFIAGDFTRSYITCSIGIWNVGYVMICYGVVDAICSFTFGRLVQYVGHIPFFALAFVMHLSSQITLLLWIPEPDKVYVFYIIAVFWGIGDAVIQTQINALYGFLFTGNPEAAFANYRLWESLGFIMAFGYSSFRCTDVKLYVCIAFLTVGMFLYGVTEFLQRFKAGSHDVTK